MSFTRTNQDLASASVIMMSFILDTCKIKGYDTCVFKKPPIENVIDSSCAFVNQAEQFIFMYYIVIFETPRQPRYCIYPKYI